MRPVDEPGLDPRVAGRIVLMRRWLATNGARSSALARPKKVQPHPRRWFRSLEGSCGLLRERGGAPRRDEEHYGPQRNIPSSGSSSAMSPIQTPEPHPIWTKLDCWVTSSKRSARLLAESGQDAKRPPRQGAPTHKAAHSFASSPNSRCSLPSKAIISLSLLRWACASARSFIS